MNPCSLLLFSLLLFPLENVAQTFLKDQLRYSRVREAKADKEDLLKKEFKEKGLSYPPKEIFLRIFKVEEQLEVWVKEDNNWHLFKAYEYCYASGHPGPKRIQGDAQVPEGFYYIDRFNPSSSYHLSLGINYPNASDKKLSDPKKPGGDIFIHGNCVSIGCVAVTDDLIKEIYLLATQAKSNGQSKIPVHIFPFDMDNFITKKYYQYQYPEQKPFWEQLEKGFCYFEDYKALPKMKVNANGVYELVD